MNHRLRTFVLFFVAGLVLLKSSNHSIASSGPASLWKVSPLQKRVVFRTPWSRVTLFHKNGYRCLAFGSGLYQLTQTCMHLKRSLDFKVEYIRMMFALSAIVPRPKRVLVLGLGGAALPRLFEKYFPNAVVDNVDIDPGVIAMAHLYFRFVNSSTMRVYASDARRFVRRMAGKVKYDLIFIDCFDDSYIPSHLLNVSFFREVAQIAKPNGVIAANVFTSHKKYKETLRTWKQVLPHLWRLSGKTSGNTIVFGSLKQRWTLAKLITYGKRLDAMYQSRTSFLKQMKKARKVQAETKGVSLLLEKKAWRMSRPPNRTTACRKPCCGFRRKWAGSFDVPEKRKRVRYSLRGRWFFWKKMCFGEFQVRWPKGRVLQLFRVRFKAGKVHMKGILVKGAIYDLDSFHFSQYGQQWRGFFVDKRGRRGPAILK